MVIRMRHTRAHTGNRRSHHAIKGKTLTADKDTKSTHVRHRLDLKTGKYRGKQIIDVVKKLVSKKEKKDA